MSTRQSSSKKPSGPITVVVLLAVAVYLLVTNRSSPPVDPGAASKAATAAVNPLDRLLQPAAGVVQSDGVGLIVLMDVSGSMGDPVADSGGRKAPKIEIARRSVLAVLGQCDRAARENPARNIQVGVYEFSAPDRGEPCRTVIPLGPLRLDQAEAAVRSMRPGGGTPIGDAVIKAQGDLAASGLARKHILVVTDGENNRGYSPGDVVGAINRLGESDRSAVYFIAFDVAAERFQGVRDAGGLVLPAGNETELRQTLDYVLTGKILAEQPETPAAK